MPSRSVFVLYNHQCKENAVCAARRRREEKPETWGSLRQMGGGGEKERCCRDGGVKRESRLLPSSFASRSAICCSTELPARRVEAHDARPTPLYRRSLSPCLPPSVLPFLSFSPELPPSVLTNPHQCLKVMRVVHLLCVRACVFTKQRMMHSVRDEG